MDWTMFFQIWFLIAVGCVLHREKMIYEEKSKQYRLMLLILTAPVGIVFNVATHTIGGLVTWLRFAEETWQGEAPTEVR